MKERLLRAIASGRAREAELEDMSRDEPADPAGRWHAKDHLAHMAWWRSRSADLVEAARAGDAPPPPVEDDLRNAITYEENRDRPLAAVKRDARASWEELSEAIQACTEDDLRKPHPDSPGSALWGVVPADAGHLGVHLMSLHLERGDEERAESAARWGYEVETSFFEQPEERADATYNLACFFARVGRVDDALPLLTRSFAAKPALRELARKDPDLDRIREHSELRELLAT